LSNPFEEYEEAEFQEFLAFVDTQIDVLRETSNNILDNGSEWHKKHCDSKANCEGDFMKHYIMFFYERLKMRNFNDEVLKRINLN
jgi:hypothetical protein